MEYSVNFEVNYDQQELLDKICKKLEKFKLTFTPAEVLQAMMRNSGSMHVSCKIFDTDFKLGDEDADKDA